MTEQTQTPNQGETEVTTEGSARVLNEVKGRLERIETGELPVIEKIGVDGSSRRVDPTGEMIRPDLAQLDAAQLDAVNEAAEAFATEHHATAEAPPARQSTPVTDGVGAASGSAPKGLWARITAWFRRG